MRYRLVALAVGGTLLSAPDPLSAQALRRSSNPRPASPGRPQRPIPQVLGPTSITQSSSTSVAALNSVSCNDGIGHTDNSYYRAFTLSAFNPPLDQLQFLVESVTFGIESASATALTQPITVRLHSSTTNPPTIASLTLLSAEAIEVADQSDTLLTVPLTTKPVLNVATDILVVEVFTPDGTATGSLFFIGSNNLGQSGPSYLRAADCGINEPTTTTAIGFPDMQIVMSVNGISQGQAADLGITKSDGKSGYFPGETSIYTITVTNAGPGPALGATVTDTFPADLSAVAWTCAASAGSSCASASGTGALNTTVDLVASGTATFAVTATASATATGSISNTATVAPPAGGLDPVPGNNSATDTNARVGGSFYTVPPCRLIDTRGPVGEFGSPPLTASGSRTFQVAGHCGVPANATAVAINLTVTAPTDAGYLQAFATGGATPLASVVNYSGGETRAGNGVYGLDVSGRLDLRCGQATGTTEAILDVSGYFID
jgi:uncharacterized repeat protein (TIGR01451 family)